METFIFGLPRSPIYIPKHNGEIMLHDLAYTCCCYLLTCLSSAALFYNTPAMTRARFVGIFVRGPLLRVARLFTSLGSTLASLFLLSRLFILVLHALYTYRIGVEALNRDSTASPSDRQVMYESTRDVDTTIHLHTLYYTYKPEG